MMLYSSQGLRPLEYQSLADAKEDGWYETLDFGPLAKAGDYFWLDRCIREISKKYLRQHLDARLIESLLCAVLDVFKQRRVGLDAPKEIGCWVDGDAVTLLFRDGRSR